MEYDLSKLTEDEKKEYLALLEEKLRRAAEKEFSSYSSEYLKITNKSGEVVPLVENYAQREISKAIKEERDAGRPPRLLILKSRQMGASTGIQGRMCYKCFTVENRNGLIVSHTDKSTRKIFGKTKFFYDRLPENVQPLQRASNTTEIILDTPITGKHYKKGLNSSIAIQTAGKTSIARGETIHYIHLSEFAFYKGTDEQSPMKQLSGAMEAVPDLLDTWVIIESTANGFNDFKTLWDDAVAGKNGFRPMFLVWYNHDEYDRPLEKDNLTEQQFINTMSEYERKTLYETLKLPLSRINWWRWKLQFTHQGDINMMKQENPSTPEEAFTFSGTPVFDNDKVMNRISELKKRPRRIKTGYFSYKWHDEEWKDYIVDETIVFVEDKNQPWIRIYEDPKDRIPYVIAGDTAGQGSDEFTGQVMNNVTQQRIATLQMDVNDSRPYTWQMYCLGRYYNDALIGVEMNFNTGPLEELNRLQYYNQYYREKSDEFDGQVIKGKVGWKTDGVTRPRMIDTEKYVVRDYTNLFNDIQTLTQMLTFVIDKDGRPDAMEGKHDDLLMADCILNEIRTQQDMRPSEVHKKSYSSMAAFFGDDDTDDYEDTLAGNFY